MTSNQCSVVMKRMNARFLILFAGSLLLNLSPLLGDDPAIHASLGAISLDDEIKGLKLMSAQELMHVKTIYPYVRNGVFSYSGSKKLFFLREVPATDPDQAPSRIPVAEVELDGKHARYLLFFSKKSGDREAYSVFSLPDTKADFPAGTYRFLNLAPYPVAIRIGEQQKVLDEMKLTDIRGDFEHGHYYQTVMLSLPKEGTRPVPAYAGRIHFNKDLRVIMVIYPKEAGRIGEIRFVNILDRMKSR